MIASDTVILAECPALVRSPIVHGLARTFAHPAHRVLEYMERIAFRNLRSVFWRRVPGIHGINPRCHLERSERPMHFACASGIHRSFASLRMTTLWEKDQVVAGRC